jgi:hypothetical protein
VLEVLNKKSTLVPSCVNLHADAADINIAANKNLVRTGAAAERGGRWPEGVQEEAVAGRRRRHQEGLHEQQRQQQSQWVLSGGNHSSHTSNGEHPGFIKLVRPNFDFTKIARINFAFIINNEHRRRAAAIKMFSCVKGHFLCMPAC